MYKYFQRRVTRRSAIGNKTEYENRKEEEGAGGIKEQELTSWNLGEGI